MLPDDSPPELPSSFVLADGTGADRGLSEAPASGGLTLSPVECVERFPTDFDGAVVGPEVAVVRPLSLGTEGSAFSGSTSSAAADGPEIDAAGSPTRATLFCGAPCSGDSVAGDAGTRDGGTTDGGTTDGGTTDGDA